MRTGAKVSKGLPPEGQVGTGRGGQAAGEGPPTLEDARGAEGAAGAAWPASHWHDMPARDYRPVARGPHPTRKSPRKDSAACLCDSGVVTCVPRLDAYFALQLWLATLPTSRANHSRGGVRPASAWRMDLGGLTGRLTVPVALTFSPP